MADSQTARIVAFPDLKPATRRQLLGGELGSQFDLYERMFGSWSGGDVLDISDWTDRDMTVMLTRDGQAAALESVLTLPIRQASRAIEPGKDDKGEAEFCRSVLMTPHTAGGMKTPLQDVIGQLTSSQIYRKAFFELVWDIRADDGRIILEKLAFRPSATCELKRNAETGAQDGFRQMHYVLGGQIKPSRRDKIPGWVDIPQVRSFVHVNGKHRSPLVGTSELDLTYWALAHGSEVQTPDGPVPIEEIAEGDFVFGSDGEPTRVTGVYPQGTAPAYRVTFSDYSSVECSGDHLWTVWLYPGQGVGTKPVKRTMSTTDIAAHGLQFNGRNRNRVFIEMAPEVAYPERELPIDPYVLGAWLGDGGIGTHRHDGPGERTGAPYMACHDDDIFIIEEMRRRLPPNIELRKSGGTSVSAAISYRFADTIRWHQNGFKDALVALGVNKKSHEKFIPEIYLYSSAKQRWDLLRGLMDTDGHIRRRENGSMGNRATYATISLRLAKDVQRLVQSLGGKAMVSGPKFQNQGRFINGYEVKSQHGLYTLEIRTPRNMHLLPRKADLYRELTDRRTTARFITSIEPVGGRECTCISVAAEDGLFLTNEFIVTHNCYKTKLKIIYLWLVFLENQALPKVVVYGQSQQQANDRADDVASMRSSGIVGFQSLPNNEKSFDILESSGKGAQSFQDALTFLETWQTSSVLAGFMGLSSLASLGRGSLALSQDQSAFFLKSRQAVTAEMEAAITHDVLAPLVTLNFGPGASYPSFKFGALTDESGQALVSLFQAMAVAPSLQVPSGILDIITERLANYLNLDIAAVDAIIQEGAKVRAEQASAAAPPGVPPKVAAGIGALAGGSAAAEKIYRKAVAESTTQPLPEDINQPFSAAPISAGAPKG